MSWQENGSVSVGCKSMKFTCQTGSVLIISLKMILLIIEQEEAFECSKKAAYHPLGKRKRG
jgi:hypothetical protein